MKKKALVWIVSVMVICAMALFGMAGCGSADGEQATEETTVEETSEEAAEATEAEMLSEGEAVEMAFDASGLYIDDADNIDVQLSTEDGTTEYIVEFQLEGVGYKYYVDAYTGDVYED